MTKTRDLADLGGGFIQAGTGAVQRTVESKLQDVVSVKDFGAVGDGVADDTAAIQAAVAASYTAYNKAVHVPCGIYKVTGTITITQGVMLVGEGSQGSSDTFGATFLHHSNGDLFVWNGAGTPYAGTGGGIQNVQLLKANTFSGGDAIKLVATSDSQRPGEMVLSNVLISNQGTGLWTRGLHVDGTAANTPGSKGVRSVVCYKLRVASCTEPDQYVYLNQAVHFSANHLQIDTGTGTGTAGLTLAGDSDNFSLSDCIINGTLLLNTSGNANCSIFGRVSNLNVANPNAIGACVGAIAGVSTNNSPNTFRVLSSQGVIGKLAVSGSLTVGNTLNTGYAAEINGVVSGYTRAGAVTTVGQVGAPYVTSCLNAEIFSFTPSSAKLFHVATGGGAAALVFADYKSSTISILSDPSSEFENSSTPTAGKTGIYKNPNDHVVYIKNGTGSTASYSILSVGPVNGTSDPA